MAHRGLTPNHRRRRLLRACRERPCRRAAECGQQFPPSDGGCHTPLPCEVRKGNDTTPRACSLAVQGGQNAGCFDTLSWASGSEAASLQRCCRVALGCSCSCDGALALERGKLGFRFLACEHGGLQFAQRLADLVERLPGLRQFPSKSSATIGMVRVTK